MAGATARSMSATHIGRTSSGYRLHFLLPVPARSNTVSRVFVIELCVSRSPKTGNCAWQLRRSCSTGLEAVIHTGVIVSAVGTKRRQSGVVRQLVTQVLIVAGLDFRRVGVEQVVRASSQGPGADAVVHRRVGDPASVVALRLDTCGVRIRSRGADDGTVAGLVQGHVQLPRVQSALSEYLVRGVASVNRLSLPGPNSLAVGAYCASTPLSFSTDKTRVLL